MNKIFISKKLIFISLILFLISLIVNAIVIFGFDYFLLVMALGPLGWPLFFYTGGSFLPFMARAGYFSIIKLLFDIIIIYTIVLISNYISIKINKNNKIIIFLVSLIIFGLLEYYLFFSKIFVMIN